LERGGSTIVKRKEAWLTYDDEASDAIVNNDGENCLTELARMVLSGCELDDFQTLFVTE
jgi:hypothetical protein